MLPFQAGAFLSLSLNLAVNIWWSLPIPAPLRTLRVDSLSHVWHPCVGFLSHGHSAVVLAGAHGYCRFCNRMVVFQGGVVSPTPNPQWCEVAIPTPNPQHGGNRLGEDMTTQRCNTWNLANVVPFEFEGEPRVCGRNYEVHQFQTWFRVNIKNTLIHFDVTYFVDGSYYRDHLGYHAGYAVVKKFGDTFVTVKAESCEWPCSTRQAELKAFIKLCKLAESNGTACAHGVCYLFEAVWKQRGFRRTDGNLVQHSDQIQELIAALMHPSKMVIIKYQAHRKGNENVIRGNNTADDVYRQWCYWNQQQHRKLTESRQKWTWYYAAKRCHTEWKEVVGCTVWAIVPGPLEVKEKIKEQGYWSLYMQAMVDEMLNQCEMCAQNNV